MEVHDEGATLLLSLERGSRPLRLPAIWLRDLCSCARCMDPTTRQRTVDALSLEPSIASARWRGEDAPVLELSWDDGHASRYPLALLDALLHPRAPAPAPTWSAAELELVERHAYEAILVDDAALLAWLEAVARDGFAFVHEVPATPEATASIARRIGYIRESVFGGLWTFRSDMSHPDSAYTRDALELHTDGTYCHDAPGLQILHCLEFRGSGGESLLVDGFHAAAQLRRSEPAAFELLRRVEVPGRYQEPGVELRARRPVLRCDAEGRVIQVSFNNGDRAPLWLGEELTPRWFAALRAFRAWIDDPSAALRFRLEPGTLLIFDNWRVLHGREAYTGTRELCGCYLDHEGFESRLRVLRRSRSVDDHG